jgi:hypothetical protein
LHPVEGLVKRHREGRIAKLMAGSARTRQGTDDAIVGF